jgi:hydroxylamine reductase (hybrid-cluster protein)
MLNEPIAIVYKEEAMTATANRSQPADYMYKATTKNGMETIYERFAKQQPHCAFGTLGVCCTLCTDVPCQITRKASRTLFMGLAVTLDAAFLGLGRL